MKALKKTIKILSLLLCMVISQVLAQGSFEGKVSYNMLMNGEAESMNMDYYIKGDQVRMEWKSEEMTQIMILKEGKMNMILPEQKMYMEFNQGMNEAVETNEPENKPVKTGETKTILGYTCEKWVVNSDDSNTEIWLAEGLGKYMFSGNPMDRNRLSWQKGMQETGFFPLLISSKNKNGKNEYKQEATEIKKMSLSDELFEIPAGYQKMTMPSMPQK